MSRLTLLAFYLLSTLHIPLQHFTGLPLHWIVWLVCMAVLFVRLNLTRIQDQTYLLGYVFPLTLVIIHSLTILPYTSVLLASLSYILIPIIFFLGFTDNPERKIDIISKANTYIACIAAFMGWYQLYVDPVLFGIYSGTSYDAIDMWAIPRASSFFGSPQVYSAYMSFSIILYDTFRFRNKIGDFGIMTAMAGGIVLSGSISGIAVVGIYFVVKYLVLFPRIFFVIAPCGFISWAVLYQLQDVLGISNPTNALTRILSAVRGGLGNFERIDIWLRTIEATPPIWGNGIGSASTLVDGSGRLNTESYWLNVYYEGGLVLLTGFAVLVYRVASIRLTARLSASRAGFLVAFVFTAMIVHVFYASALSIIWVLLFSFAALGTSRGQGTAEKARLQEN